MADFPMPPPTVLSPQEESAFNKWRRTLPGRLNETNDYDLRGFFHEHPGFNINTPGQHLPDTFKLPNHDTFSNESRYYNDQTAPYGGKWEQHADHAWSFIPNDPTRKHRIDEDANGNRMTPSNGPGGGVLSQMFMKPSETGKDSVTLDELSSLIPSDKGKPDKYGRKTTKGDPWGDYLKTMQYLTQPSTDMGPDARRAVAGMPPMPSYNEPVELQQPSRGSSLMALLFGGLK